MTKSTDKSLIEDTEIAPEDLVEGLAEDAEATDADENDGADVTAIADDDADDSAEDGDDKKFVDRRKPAEVDRRKTTTRRATMLIRLGCI